MKTGVGGGGVYAARYQNGSFSLINVRSGFHCLRVFYFLFIQLKCFPMPNPEEEVYSPKKMNTCTCTNARTRILKHTQS
jgi:hypothetical protein